MSAATPGAVKGRAEPDRRRVTQARVARSEWTKLHSVRSTRWTLRFVTLALIIGLAGCWSAPSSRRAGRTWSLIDRLRFN